MDDTAKHTWVRAEGGENRSVIYHDKNGNRMIRYLDPTAKDPPRGSKSWRHQNPGNIIRGAFANEHGAIGSAGYPSPDNPSKVSFFAIFPDYEIGRKALAALLKTEKYIGLAEEKTLLAVVVHGHFGVYLRSFPYHQKFMDMFRKKL